MSASSANPEKNEASTLCDIGFIGLGVMGKNLTLNLVDNGYKVACFDLDQSKVDAILSQDQQERKTPQPRVVGCRSYTELLKKSKSPAYHHCVCSRR